jgi:hypothetical protein
LKQIERYNCKLIPRWLSFGDACRYASMPLRKMKYYIKTGEIFAIKKGRWFVDRESIDNFFLNDSGERLMVEKVLASFR